MTNPVFINNLAGLPPLPTGAVLATNIEGVKRAVVVHGEHFYGWCFRVINGKWVTYQQLPEMELEKIRQQEQAQGGI